MVAYKKPFRELETLPFLNRINKRPSEKVSSNCVSHAFSLPILVQKLLMLFLMQYPGYVSKPPRVLDVPLVTSKFFYWKISPGNLNHSVILKSITRKYHSKTFSVCRSVSDDYIYEVYVDNTNNSKFKLLHFNRSPSMSWQVALHSQPVPLLLLLIFSTYTKCKKRCKTNM